MPGWYRAQPGTSPAIETTSRTKRRLRLRGDADSERVVPIELFFDLVFVFAISQLSTLLGDHLSVGGAMQSALLLLAVWGAWIHTGWATNFFDPDSRAMRVLILGLMLASLLMSAALPAAYAEHGLLFAGAYLAIQLGRSAFIAAALEEDHHLRLHFRGALIWFAGSAPFWLAGALAEGAGRVTLWAFAILIEFGMSITGLFTRTDKAGWSLMGSHLAERCQLFLILALGESIVITGITFAERIGPARVTAALVVAFLSTAGLWWIYFDRLADYGTEVITDADEPARVALIAYSYFHVPMVAGIIVSAVADQLSISAPSEPGGGRVTAVALGGPALFLLGFSLFVYAVNRVVPVAPLVAVVALAALIPVGLEAPRLVTSACATAVVLGVAGWVTWAARKQSHPVGG
jgi:low temperature requirement protein LtrA